MADLARGAQPEKNCEVNSLFGGAQNGGAAPLGKVGERALGKCLFPVAAARAGWERRK
jgi:hypothetical protein